MESKAKVVSKARVGAAVTPLALGLLTALGGCTALLETSKLQCTTEQDCIDLAPDSTYQCVRNVCEQPLCDQDKTCRDLGGRFATSFCDTTTNSCVPAECEKSDDCGGGLACDLSSNRCVQRECQVQVDCMTADKASPTVQCLDGFCVDPTWGCIGDPDPRNYSPGEFGTLRVPLYDPSTQGPLDGSDWSTLVCRPAAEDPDCLQPLDVPTSYDPITGIVTVEQLDPTRPVRLWLTETKLPLQPNRLNGKATVDMEFITQKPPVGVTTTPPLRVVTWIWIGSLIESYVKGGIINGSDESIRGIFETGKQTIFGDAFDCEDKPAANLFVKLTSERTGEELKPALPGAPPGTGYRPYFWDEQNIAHQPPSHLATFGTGVWSTANLPIDETLLLDSNIWIDDRQSQSRVVRSKIPVYLDLFRFMTIHLYPRDYTTLATP